MMNVFSAVPSFHPSKEVHIFTKSGLMHGTSHYCYVKIFPLHSSLHLANYVICNLPIYIAPTALCDDSWYDFPCLNHGLPCTDLINSCYISTSNGCQVKVLLAHYADNHWTGGVFRHCGRYFQKQSVQWHFDYVTTATK